MNLSKMFAELSRARRHRAGNTRFGTNRQRARETAGWRRISYRRADVALSEVWDFGCATDLSGGPNRFIDRVPLREEAVPMQELPETVFCVLDFNRNKTVSGCDKAHPNC
jgi:hypothetical protein